MQTRDPLVSRFTQLRESGMSREEAWKVMAVEFLVDAGLISPEKLEPGPVLGPAMSGQVPVYEAKLVKVIRIEPVDDDRIQTLVAQAGREASISKRDSPSQSSLIRRALRLGLDELERNGAKK